jgi:hypothetical protein
LAAEAGVRRREGVVALVRVVPAWAWLTGLVILSSLVRYAMARRSPAPWIMVDELIYSELAKSFAESGRFLVRGEATAAYGLVYPVLIAPAWALFNAVPQAYEAAKAINSVVMSLAAVPAYLLARRVLAPGFSLAVATLTVAVPSMVYTATLMTENAFYPIFVASALAVVLWLERPTRLRTAAVFMIFMVSFLTRQQAIALLPAFATAPFLVAGRDALRRYALMYWLLAAGAVLVLVEQVARGVSPLGVFGAYEVAGRTHYSVVEIGKWFVYHVGELDLALGAIPFAALLLLAARIRFLEARDRAFVAAAVSLSFWLVLEVAVFASKQTERIEERNMFYVAPLFFVALFLWIERGLPRPHPAATVAAGVAAALPLVIPYQDLIGVDAVSDTPALMPLLWLTERGLGLTDVVWVAFGGCALAALAFLLVPRRYALLLPAIVLVYFAISHHPVVAEDRYRSEQHLFGGIRMAHADWIDRVVGTRANVSMVWTGVSDKFSVWENEFFNRSVGTIYTIGPAVPGGLAQVPLTVDGDTGDLLSAGGHSVRADYALTDASLELAGRKVAEDPRTTMVVYRVYGALRKLSFVTGLYPEGTWSKGLVTYRRNGCGGGVLDVELQSDPALFLKPNDVIARVRGRVVARAKVFPTHRKTLRVPLRPEPGTDRCVVRFNVARTAIPAVVTGGLNPDPRPLGMHFNRFTYRP